MTVAERESLTVTRAPRAFRKRAAARPLLPRPTTRTRLFVSSNMVSVPTLSQLQCRQCKQREDQGQDPEPGNNLGLRPSAQLEVMMQRRHAKNALAPAQLIAAHLENHAQRLQDEYSADKREQ